MADELIVVHEGRAVRFDGDLEDYAKWLASGGPVPAISSGGTAPPIDEPPGPGAAVDSAVQRKLRRRQEAAQRDRLNPLRGLVQREEQKLDKLARERAELERQLAAPELYEPAARARLRALLARQKELQRQSAEAEAAWLEASSQLESAVAQPLP